MDINTEISLPENTFEVIAHALVDETINIENRTEIKLLEKQSELLTLNKKATEAQGYPNLSLNANYGYLRSEEHTSELQSRPHLVCRLLLEKKNKTESIHTIV